MEYLKIFSSFIEDITGINKEYIFLTLLSLLSFVIIKIISFILKKIFNTFDRKKGYILYQKCNIVLTIIDVIIIFIIWDSYLDKIITVITFVSAAITLALKDVIFNFFSGLYIHIKKPFNIDDRIEFNGLKGDVVGMNTLDFEVLEIGDYINDEQSTGKVINVPNSYALTYPIKNYGKMFKYIWKEITVKTSLDVDVDIVKENLINIINSNDVVKAIPNKIKKTMEHLEVDQRIYFNKLDPIIYMKVVDNHIEFYVRYLMHPKKNRYVEDDFWQKVLMLNKEGTLKLYVE
jgi:small-conductance mechanosensitive channel